MLYFKKGGFAVNLYGARLRRISTVVLVLLSALCILPLLLIVMSSFTAEEALNKNGYSLFPEMFSLESYRYILSAWDQLGRAYLMTLAVTVVGTVLSVTVITLFAYPLSNKKLPGHTFFSFALFFTMLFRGGLIPSYLVWTQVFHIKDTFFALLLPNLLMSGFSVIVMRTYFSTSIPPEIIEAATIDGASEWRILGTVVLPMALPVISTIAFMSGLNYWNDWQNGLYYLVKRTDLFTIQNLLNRMLSSTDYLKNQGTNALIALGVRIPSVGIRMAISVIALVPIMVIYPFLQKGFIRGITIGGVKG